MPRSLTDQAGPARTALAHHGPVISAASGETVRLFVAIAPPASVLDELAELAAPFQSSRQDLRWTNRGAWHVTLAFLGEVQESTLDNLLPRLERAAGRHHEIGLAFAGAGAFPHVKRANVLWSGLSGDRCALASLVASVTAGAKRAGAPPPDKGRRFEPHLTLARCRLPADVTGIVAALSGYHGLEWSADRIHLVRSHLGGGKPPQYSTVAWWPLRGPAPAEADVTTTG